MAFRIGTPLRLAGCKSYTTYPLDYSRPSFIPSTNLSITLFPSVLSQLSITLQFLHIQTRLIAKSRVKSHLLRFLCTRSSPIHRTTSSLTYSNKVSLTGLRIGGSVLLNHIMLVTNPRD